MGPNWVLTIKIRFRWYRERSVHVHQVNMFRDFFPFSILVGRTRHHTRCVDENYDMLVGRVADLHQMHQMRNAHIAPCSIGRNGR
jgi:hypothetical protein